MVWWFGDLQAAKGTAAAGAVPHPLRLSLQAQALEMVLSRAGVAADQVTLRTPEPLPQVPLRHHPVLSSCLDQAQAVRWFSLGQES